MLTVDQKSLLAALSMATKAVEGRVTIPILACCRIEAHGGTVRIMGSNLDVWVETECEGEGQLDACCPSAAKLLAAVRAAGAGELRLEERPTGLLMRHGTGRALLPLLPANEYPGAQPVEGGGAVKVAAQELERAIALVEPSISTETARLYLGGAHLATGRNGVRLAATDGHRLDRVAVAAEADGEVGAIIPRQTVKLLRGLTGDVTLRFADGRLRARAEGLTITSQLIAGTFPDVDRIIPTVTDPIVSLNAADLLAALERVAWAADDRDRCVGLRFRPGESILIWAVRSAGAEGAVVECDCEALREADIGFGAHYLASLMSRLGGSEIGLYGGASAPCRFVRPGSDDGHVIMTMRISPYQPTMGMSDE